jgi:hypothetical protein
LLVGVDVNEDAEQLTEAYRAVCHHDDVISGDPCSLCGAPWVGGQGWVSRLDVYEAGAILRARVAELEAEVARLLAAAAAVEVQPLSRCVACGQYYCRCET